MPDTASSDIGGKKLQMSRISEKEPNFKINRQIKVKKHPRHLLKNNETLKRTSVRRISIKSDSQTFSPGSEIDKNNFCPPYKNQLFFWIPYTDQTFPHGRFGDSFYGSREVLWSWSKYRPECYWYHHWRQERDMAGRES